MVKVGERQEAKSTSGAEPSLSWLYVLVSLLFAVVVIFAARGVRGTDQYWYVDEVDALAHGKQSINYAYPVGLMKTGRLPQRFVHNTLNHHVVAPAATLLGAYGGWIAADIAASLMVAALIAAVV